MSVLIAAILALQTPPPVQEPIRNWTFQRTETNPRTGREEVLSIVEGDEALAVDLTEGKEVFDVRGVRARYFTEPKREGDKSETIRLEAEHARLDNTAGRLELSDRVVILREEDGTRLEAPSALALFHKKFVCPAGHGGTDESGACRTCGAERKEKTFASFSIEDHFTLTQPEMRLTGEGLSADDALREMTVIRNGSLRMTGLPREVAAAPARATHEIHCQGPMKIRELPGEPARIIVELSDRVRMCREDFKGSLVMTADWAQIEAVRRNGPDRENRMSPEKFAARGGIAIEDNHGLRVTAETLEWETTASRDEAVLAGKPLVSAEQGGNRVRSRRVILERLKRCATFREEVTADLTRRADANAPPLRLSSAILVATADEAGSELRRIEAIENVRIDGLVQREEGASGTAQADRFLWDLAEDRGLLTARPFVRIALDENLILAPKIVLSGSSTAVLKGPKRLRLTQPREEGAEPFVCTASSEGDMVIDFEAGDATLLDRCSIHAPGFALTARRVDLRLAPGGRGLENLRACGDVRALRMEDGTVMYGDRLRYDPSAKTLSVTGQPYAIAEAGPRIAYQQEIRFDERTRVTEMCGGAAGLRILIENR